MLSVEERRKKFNIPNDPILAKNKTLALNIIAPDRDASIIRAYIRVSTLKQKIEGHSLDSQEEQIKDYCRNNNLPGHIIIYKDEAVSGRATKREHFDRMCDDLRIGDTIITYSMSRLGRNMDQVQKFFRDMKARYIKVICLKENFNFDGIAAEIFLTVMSLMLQLESDFCRSRTQDVMHRLKENGTLRTKPRFGYGYIGTGKDRTIVEKPEEQQIINFILAIITGDPNICDSEITRLINSEITNKLLNYKNKPKIFQSSVTNIINKNNLRSDTVDHINRRIELLETIADNSKDVIVHLD
jgi:DNA invertase Pin-like site-specific DNA recombinase